MGFEIVISITSLVIAWFVGGALYPFAPGLFDWVGKAIPQPVTATGIQVAYVTGAGMVFLVSNTVLFLGGYRRL